MKYLLLPLLLLAGCASGPDPVSWTQPVRSEQAAFLWKHSGGSLAGNATILSDSTGNVMIQLNKNLPQPLLELTSTRVGQFSATGPLAGGGWSGDASNAPLRFSLWTALAAAWRGAQPANEGRQEVHTSAYRAAMWKQGGRLRELSVSSSDNGEVVRLVFR